MKLPTFPIARYPFFRELLLILAFLGLTIIMTWPWALHLRNAVADRGDPYNIAWTLWWDYHQTFHAPLDLFQANTFYPYHDSLAFGENDYGIALLFFPLFALGLRPLTVHCIATLAGFAFSGYGAFRLARTLTGSNRIAWIAGVVFAFIPYRFFKLSHLHYLFAGWIPLLLEALVLFARERTSRRAAWFGIAFFMNALTCVTWFILTLIPLGLSAALLLIRYRLMRERAFWRRGGLALAAALLALLPFLLPYYRVAHLYGFVRDAQETAIYSANLLSWLNVDWRVKFWQGLGRTVAGGYSETLLFPGLLPPLLALAALFLVKPATIRAGTSPDRVPPSLKIFLVLLDALAICCTVVALLTLGYGIFKFRLFGIELFSVRSPRWAFTIAVIAVFIRCYLARPVIFRRIRETNLLASLRSSSQVETLAIGAIWIIVGFFGSLGMNFPFHRLLFKYVPLFQSMRVPARWAMICYLGLSLLAGLGAARLAELFARRLSLKRTAPIYVAIALALLYEQHVIPLPFVAGEVDPDQITLRLKGTPMRGGIVELPVGDEVNHLYVLRAADHGRPLITATNSFIPPLEREIESLAGERPIPDRFLDLLESIPASYLVIHNSSLAPENRLAVESFLARGRNARRLRFIRSYDERDDLYAVVKTEPQTQSEAPLPPPVTPGDLVRQLNEESLYLPAEFRKTGYFVYRLYKVSYGAMPRLAQFVLDVQATGQGVTVGTPGWEQQLEINEQQFAESWVNREAFRRLYDGKSDEQFVNQLFVNAGTTPAEAERAALVNGLNNGSETRATALRKVADNELFYLKEFDAAFVLMHYFGYLHRNPDDPPDNNMEGHKYWTTELNNTSDYSDMGQKFIDSREYRSRLGEP